MQIVVLGAAGATGREVVTQARDAGHQVVAFARSGDRVPVLDGVRIVTGDATRVADLRVAFADADVVVSTLGGAGSVITDSTAAVVAAAGATGVKRVVVLSSFAVQRDRLSAPLKAMTSLVMGKIVADKAAGEALLRSSELDWTLVYATVLTDGPATAAAHAVPDGVKIGMRDKISRADVARLLLEVATADDHRRAAVTITG